MRVLNPVMFLSCLLASAHVSAQPVTLRVQAPGLQPDGSSSAPAVSADGRVVVFRSSASNLVPGSPDGTLFALDVGRDEISALAPTANGNVFGPSVSADGRYVAFETSANNLAPGMDSSSSDVLWLDRESGEFRRASQGFGQIAANGGSQHAAISGDGRYVAFTSLANNLVAPATTANRRHVYVMDMENGLIDLVSRNAAFEEGNRDALALEPNAYSSDGRRLVFTTAAENIAPVFAGNVSDVLVRHFDPGTGQSTWENVNRSVAGEVGTLSSSGGSISPNGRYVVFRSGAGNIVANQPGDSDLFVRDLDANTLRAVRAPAGYSACTRSRVTDRGDVVMLCAPDAGTTALQVFLAPASGAAPQMRSVNLLGDPGNASSGQAFTVSADGELLAMESAATDLVENDTNVAGDVFLLAEPAFFDRLFRNGFE